MNSSTYVNSFLVILAIVNPAKGFLCLLFPCGARNTANATNTADATQTATSAPQMITSPGSVCTCLLHNQSRVQRDALVTEIMKYNFVDLTLSVSDATEEFVSFSNDVFNLETFILDQAKAPNLESSTNIVLNGDLFFVDWIEETRDYFRSYNTLALYINQWYVDPLGRELLEIAVSHGTSIGVFRAGQTLTYDGICYAGQNWTGPYLFEQQCKINLSYLVRVAFNGTCNTTEKEKMYTVVKIEAMFDIYFSLTSEKFVRSAIFNVSQTSNTTDIFLELFYNADVSIWDIERHLQSMNPLSVTCENSQKVDMYSPISLVSCTWCDPAFNTTHCMPSNGTSTSVNFTTQASTGAQNSFAGTNFTTDSSATTIASTSRTDTPPSPTPQGNSGVQNPPSGSANSTGTGNSTSSQNSTQSQTSTTLLTTQTTITATQSTITATQSTITATQSTITTASDTSNNGQSAIAISSTGGSTALINTSPSSMNASNNLPTNSPAASNGPASGISNSVATSTPSSQASAGNQNASSTMASPLTQSNSTTTVSGSPAGNSGATMAGSYTGKTTPFDEDPFFKAVVPVFTKKFNDEYLLRAVGTMRPITAHNDFYWITVPLCIVAVILAMLCMMCLQVDWLIVCGGKWKETQNLIK